MAYPEERTTSLRGCLIVNLLMVVSTFACILFGYVTADVLCVQHADPWLVDYEGSELVREDYSFVRPFGIGRTTRVLYVDENPNVVRAWYQDRNREIDRDGESTSGIGSISLPKISGGPDGEGAIITMGTSCVTSLDFTP